MDGKIFLFLIIISVSLAEKIRYDNYALYRIYPRSVEQVNYLKELYEKSNEYDFWKPPSNVDDFVSVVAPPELKHNLAHFLDERSIHAEVVSENIQEAFDEQRPNRRKRNTNRDLYWTGYQTLDDINAWFEELAETHPNVVSLVVGGRSHEGRNITGVKISRRSGRQAFVLEAGSVGADWLSPVILTYIVNQLVNSDNAEARQASEDYDWYIFPVTNPDGFEFTQLSTRLWYKNRRPVASNAVGVDLTKNWNSHWAANGGSHTASDNNFIGLGPFSEPETRAFSSFIESIDQTLAGFLSFRSFGQRMIIPFAYTTTPLYNYNEMITIGRRAMGSLSVKYGTQYLVGTSGAVSDGATGNIADWVKYRRNPPIAATFLLRDTGIWGYTLPVDQVQPSCEETFDGLMAILREAKLIDVL